MLWVTDIYLRAPASRGCVQFKRWEEPYPILLGWMFVKYIPPILPSPMIHLSDTFPFCDLLITLRRTSGPSPMYSNVKHDLQ